MTTTQVGETSVTVNKNSPIQDYVHVDDQTQPTFNWNWYTEQYTTHVIECLYMKSRK